MENRRRVEIYLLSAILFLAFIYLGEQSICKTISCMREKYDIGDELCYFTTDSYSIQIDERKNGNFTKLYSALKNIVFPLEYTVVKNKSKNGEVIALIQEGDLFPFYKDYYQFDDTCRKTQ